MNKRFGCLLVAGLLALTVLAGCDKTPAGSEVSAGGETLAPNPGGVSIENGGKDVFADYEAEGKVVVAINKGRSTDFQGLVDTFANFYKNIDLKVDYFEAAGGTPEHMTASAASGNMPDVVFDDYSSLAYTVSQGWAYPLNGFVKGDGDFEYVPQVLKDFLSYNGRLYAVPNNIHFYAMFMNMDILDALNLDPPPFDWTYEEYGELLKKATTDTYSGTEAVFNLDMLLPGTSHEDLSVLGYNYETHRFDLRNSWAEAVRFMRGLREVPGLEAWYMRWNTEDPAQSDYAVKFGNGDLTDMNMAMKMGKTLSDTPRGTWDAWLYNLPFNWELWPYPQGEDTKGRLPMACDYSYMTSGVEKDNEEAAFQVLRFLSYSIEGNKARLAMFDEENKGKYLLNNKYYIPVSAHPDMVEKFKSLPTVSDSVKFMYDCMDTSFMSDPEKVVPGFNEVHTEYILDNRNQVADGKMEAAAAAAEMEDRANQAIADRWEDFNASLQKVEKDFDAAHPGWND